MFVVSVLFVILNRASARIFCCSFEVFGGGPTRLLVSASARARIEVKEPAETRPLITLAFDELNEVISSASNRKRVEDYLTAFCEPADEV